MSRAHRHRVDGRVLRVDAAAAVLEDDHGERLVEPLVAPAAQDGLRALLLARGRAALEGHAEEGALDEAQRGRVGRLREQQAALRRPLVAGQRGEHREGVVVALLEQRPLGERECVRELRLQLLQAERCARCGVEGHGHHRALAHDDDVLRVGVLDQLVLALLGHARHAEDAQELVHVQRVATHRLDRDGPGVQRRAILDQPVAHRRRCLHVGERQPPFGQHTEPVDVHGHRGA